MRIRRKCRRKQRGISLVEVLIATAILSITGMSLLLGLTTGIQTTDRVSDGRAATDAAQSQMESIKLADWSVNGTAYSVLPTDELPGDVNMSDITITVTRPDGGSCLGNETLQRILVEVAYGDDGVVALEGYKADRMS
jgi:prepilin-type N-terminal cleavage/methylation domain-containing protein